MALETVIPKSEGTRVAATQSAETFWIMVEELLVAGGNKVAQSGALRALCQWRENFRLSPSEIVRRSDSAT